MGVFLRKSISAGPIRFNLSKSGIGVSAGVTGLRIGSGPRGGYVNAGRGGIYYRKSLGSPRWTDSQSGNAPIELPVTVGDNLEGADVEELVEALPSELTDRIQVAANLRKPSFLANPFSYRRRKLTWQADRAVPLFYDLDDEFLSAYSDVVEVAERLAASSGRYYDRQSQRLDQRTGDKGHGGAGSLLDRVSLSVRAAAPPDVALNFEPPEFAAPDRSLFLLPDQGLVREGKAYASIPLKSLTADVHLSRFITTNVPAGVTPVEYTWTYVNKSGGPDGRFKENPRLPVIEVGEIDFYGPGGFQFHSGFTDLSAVRAFDQAFTRFRTLVVEAGSGES